MLKFLEKFKRRKPRFHWEAQGEPNNYRVRDNQLNRWFMLVLMNGVVPAEMQEIHMDIIVENLNKELK